MADMLNLPEHQSYSNVSESKPVGYEPTPEERKAIKLVEQLFQKAKKHRAKYDEKWMDYYKFFRGKQWKEARPSYRHSEVINMVFQAIQSTVPIITDSKPKIEYLPQEPSDMELAQILNEVAESDWENENWLMKLMEVVYDAHFFGAGMSSVEYDPKAEFGLGKITYQSEDPFYCFPDPNARNVNDKARYFVHAEPVDIEEIKREYPDKADFIKADVIDLAMGERTELDKTIYKSPVDARSYVDGMSQFETTDKSKVLKITVYLFSDDFDEEEKETGELDELGQPKVEYVQKLKFPQGRKLCVAGGVLLTPADAPIPFDDVKFPYQRLLNYILPREFWGISEVEQLEGPQRIFNKLLSFALDVLTLMGNPIWIVDNDSDVDTDNLFNRPGLVVEKNKGTEVRREEGVQLQPYVLQLIDRMKTWFDGVSGVNDVTRGVRPEGITAAKAITELQEAAQTRLRLKSRLLDAYLKEVGQAYMSRVFQFYDAPRVFRLTNNPGSQKYFKFHVEKVVDEAGNPVMDEAGNPARVAKVRNYIQPQDGAPGAWGAERAIEIRANFDVRASTGSSLPFAKAEKANLATMLFDRKAIDRAELLKATDYPNWEAVLQRIEAQEQQMAQQQAMAQAAGAPQAPPA